MSNYLWPQIQRTPLNRLKTLHHQFNSKIRSIPLSQQQRLPKKRLSDREYREGVRQQHQLLRMESRWDLKSQTRLLTWMRIKEWGSSWGIEWLLGRQRKRLSITYSKRVKMSIAVRDQRFKSIELFTSAFSEKFIRISFEDESKKSVLIIEYNQSYIEVMGILSSSIYQGASYGGKRT